MDKEPKTRGELEALLLKELQALQTVARIQRVYVYSCGQGDWDFGAIWNSSKKPTRSEIDAVAAPLHDRYDLLAA
jgi:hypothetical protein